MSCLEYSLHCEEPAGCHRLVSRPQFSHAPRPQPLCCLEWTRITNPTRPPEGLRPYGHLLTSCFPTYLQSPCLHPWAALLLLECLPLISSNDPRLTVFYRRSGTWKCRRSGHQTPLPVSAPQHRRALRFPFSVRCANRAHCTTTVLIGSTGCVY